MDIHSEPQDSENAKEKGGRDDNDSSIEDLLSIAMDRDECFYPTVCDKCSDNENESADTRPKDQKNCDTCKIRRVKSLNGFLREKTSFKASLKDSIKNILDAVGTMAGSSKLLHKLHHTRKSVSLTELSDSKSVRTTKV